MLAFAGGAQVFCLFVFNTKKFSEPEATEVPVEHLQLASWVRLGVRADLAAAQRC